MSSQSANQQTPYCIIKWVLETVYKSIIAEKTPEEIKNIIEEYIAWTLKDDILQIYFPEEYSKSKNITSKVFQRLLDNFADPDERLHRHRKTIENLQSNNSDLQRERWKKWWAKKRLSSEEAASMGRLSHNPLTPDQISFVLNLYKNTEWNRQFRLTHTAQELKHTFSIERTPNAIRGVIERANKKIKDITS